ncbi:hypothetical protein F5Y15DRAFT_76391 [Xylariaceae sp. FL0016]|nr:hypothetical protein F5Y15DRAFT_76391 [Xylariaceae sp. FL0016]
MRAHRRPMLDTGKGRMASRRPASACLYLYPLRSLPLPPSLGLIFHSSLPLRSSDSLPILILPRCRTNAETSHSTLCASPLSLFTILLRVPLWLCLTVFFRAPLIPLFSPNPPLSQLTSRISCLYSYERRQVRPYCRPILSRTTHRTIDLILPHHCYLSSSTTLEGSIRHTPR